MVLRLDGVSKSYGPVCALDRADLVVAPGECRALYGGNGSGKSTLARIVSGAVAPTSGRVTVDERPLDRPSPRRARDLGVGITFQELSLLPELSVAENIVIGAIPTRFGLFADRRRMREKALEHLAPMGLARFCDAKVGTLQTGEKYLVELAKTLYLKPRYLIIDELTTTMHASEVDIFAGLLDRHLADGGGVLFVSHRLNELRRFCSTITVLHNGHQVAEERLATVSDAALVGWAGGREAVAALSETGHPGRAGEEPSRQPPSVVVENLPLGDRRAPFSHRFGRGEIVGLGGLPGQGQKPLLRVLAGLDAPQGAPRVTLDGKALAFGSAVAAANAGIVYVGGDRDETAFATCSIRENMLAPFLARGARRPRDGALKDALARLSTRYAGLDMPMNALSGGNQQKVLIARCLLADPKVLVAEDPTKGIDVAARADVHRLFRELAANGTTVLVTSSDDLELAELCDRVLVMEAGDLVADLDRAGGHLSVQAIVGAYMKQEKAA